MMRMHDTRRYLVSIAHAIEAAVGIPSHIDGQNNAPPPATGVYANIKIIRGPGPRAGGRTYMSDAMSITSATVTVPPLPAVGTNLFVRPRPKSALPAVHTVAGGDTITGVRDSLLTQLVSHVGGDAGPPVFGASYWSASAVGADSIELTPFILGGLGVDIPAQGLTVVVDTTDATRLSHQGYLTARVSIRGTSRLSADDLDSIFGSNGAQSIASTIMASLLASDVAPILTQAGLELALLPLGGVLAPASVGGSIEYQHVTDIDFGCKGLGFRAPRVAATTTSATITTLSPAVSGATAGSSITNTLAVSS